MRAFVLVGGGSLGSVQAGMLQALLCAGIAPDLVVGTSVGALNGALLAGAPTVAGVEALGALWRGLRRRDVFPVEPLRAAVGAGTPAVAGPGVRAGGAARPAPAPRRPRRGGSASSGLRPVAVPPVRRAARPYPESTRQSTCDASC